MINKGILLLYYKKILRNIPTINRQPFKLYQFSILGLCDIKLYSIY